MTLVLSVTRYEVGAGDLLVGDRHDPIAGGDRHLLVGGADSSPGQTLVFRRVASRRRTRARLSEEATEVLRLGQRTILAGRGHLDRVLLAIVTQQLRDLLAVREGDAVRVVDEQAQRLAGTTSTSSTSTSGAPVASRASISDVSASNSSFSPYKVIKKAGERPLPVLPPVSLRLLQKLCCYLSTGKRLRQPRPGRPSGRRSVLSRRRFAPRLRPARPRRARGRDSAVIAALGLHARGERQRLLSLRVAAQHLQAPAEAEQRIVVGGSPLDDRLNSSAASS